MTASSPSDGPRPRFDVIVMGAGQAGLAMGYFLARRGLRFLILERASAVGSAWRERWDSLILFTPARFSGLPGLPFPGDPDHHPTRDEVVAYLERYAERFRLPIAFDRRVDSVAARDGRYVVRAGDVEYEADQVVVATGPFQVPRLPDFAERLSPDVVQMHSTGYRRPGDLPAGDDHRHLQGRGRRGQHHREERGRDDHHPGDLGHPQHRQHHSQSRGHGLRCRGRDDRDLGQ